MNKKAFTEMLLLLGKIGAVVLIGMLAFSIANALGSTDTPFRINTAEDIRMMIHTLAAVPGDALVNYSYNVSRFNIVLDSKKVILFEKDDPETKRVVRDFILPSGYTAVGTLKEESRLCLEKKQKTITLRGCLPNEP